MDEEVEKNVLRLLLLGIHVNSIQNLLNRSSEDIQKIKEILKGKGKITEDKIKEALEVRRKRDKSTVYNLLLLGYSYKEIANEIPYADKNYVVRLANNLRKEKLITDAEIEEAKFERNEKYKKEVILNGLEQGLSQEEIIEEYKESVKNIEGIKNKTISRKIISDYTKKLLNQGVITKEQIERKRLEGQKIRIERRKEQHVGPHEERVLELLKLGFYGAEIAKVTELTLSYISQIKRKLEKRGKITEEEIQEAIENRQEETEKRQTHIAKIINFSEDINEDIVQQHIEYSKVTYALNELSEKDFKLLQKVIPMDEKLVSFDNINFILRVLTKRNEDSQAVAFIDECIVACEDDKKRNGTLKEAKRQIENKIMQLRKRDITMRNKVITIPRCYSKNWYGKWLGTLNNKKQEEILVFYIIVRYFKLNVGALSVRNTKRGIPNDALSYSRLYYFLVVNCKSFAHFIKNYRNIFVDKPKTYYIILLITKRKGRSIMVEENTDEERIKNMVDNLVERAKVAAKKYLELDQETVNNIIKKMSMAGLENHMKLAKMAVEETGRGIYEDKITKNMFATEYVYHSIKYGKTVGVISENEEEGYVEIAEPVGIIAGVTPVTNPTSTAMFKSLIAAKTRNVIIFGFHPSAQKCSVEAARILRDAAIQAGAPEDCILWIEEPSITATNFLMHHKDVNLILATGGTGMVRAAYSCGKPALGVGPRKCSMLYRKVC